MASFDVSPEAFNTAEEYAQFVDQYNAGTPQERYDLVKSKGLLDPTFDEFIQKSGGIENNFGNKLGSLGDDKGFLGIKWGEFGDWLDNLFTGNRDYNRSVYVQGLDQKFNAIEAQKQRDYEERLANTAYQRASADAQASGFNPGLIMLQGGAATPVGSAARTSHNYSQRSGEGGLKLISAIFGAMMTAMSLMSRASSAGAVEAAASVAAQKTLAGASKTNSWYSQDHNIYNRPRSYSNDVDDETAKILKGITVKKRF